MTQKYKTKNISVQELEEIDDEFLKRAQELSLEEYSNERAFQNLTEGILVALIDNKKYELFIYIGIAKFF